MRLVFVIGIVTFYKTIISHGDPIPSNTGPAEIETRMRDSEQFVVNLARNFSSKYFQELTTNPLDPRVNSPLSTYIPMFMLSNGAREETRKKYLSAIGLSEDKTKMATEGFKTFLEKLKEYDVAIATKIFVQDGFTLNPHFLNLSKNVFNSESESIEVDDGFLDGDKISEWISDKTNGKIVKNFRTQEIGCDTAIVFANTIYHNAHWEVGFNKSRTTLRYFDALGARSIKVSTMNTVGLFSHGRIEEIGASFIELPYKSLGENNAMSMFIIMADEADDQAWQDMIPKLKNMDLTKLLNSTKKELNVYLPKFTLPDVQNLDPPFNSMAREVLVDVTDISGISMLPNSSIISYAKSKTMVNVDEEGQQTAQLSMISYSTRDCSICDTYVDILHKCRAIAATKQGECNMKEFRSALRITRAAVPVFEVNRPFIAIIMTKGNIFTDIFSINFSGSEFYYSGY